MEVPVVGSLDGRARRRRPAQRGGSLLLSESEERPGRLTVLGCDGSYPGPGGAASGYLVEGAGVSLWLDAGPGTFASLQLVTDPSRLDAVILSHEHPDHWSDVESFAVWLREAARRDPQVARRSPLPVYAPPGLRARSYFGDDPLLAWREVEPAQRIVVRPMERAPQSQTANAAESTNTKDRGARPGEVLVCSFCATDHGPPTLAVRFDVHRGGWAGSEPELPDRSLAYSADTGPGWSVEELGQRIGTFLCEATYGSAEEGSARHLSGRQAGAMAEAADVGVLVLTHRRPSVRAEDVREEAAAAFGRDVAQAAPKTAFEW